MEQCHNSPGSYRCSCTYGHILAGDGHSCIAECAPGYKKQLTIPENSTAQAFLEECVGKKKCRSFGWSTLRTMSPYFSKEIINLFPQLMSKICLSTDVNECQEERCEWQCVNLPGSHRCICPKGYTLHRDGHHCKGQCGRAHSCTHICNSIVHGMWDILIWMFVCMTKKISPPDINECSRKNGGCSHLCVNQNGAYKCACPPSHRLSPYSWKKCVPRTTANTAGWAGKHTHITVLDGFSRPCWVSYKGGDMI